MSKLIKKELDIGDYEEKYWIHSKVILGHFIKKVKLEFFVANRVQAIKKHSNIE